MKDLLQVDIYFVSCTNGSIGLYTDIPQGGEIDVRASVLAPLKQFQDKFYSTKLVC